MENNYKKRLASLALFRKLYDQKKDIYFILDVFIKDAIHKCRLVSFSAFEIKNLIQDEYGFNSIPEGVISATLKRAYKKENGKFFVDQNVVVALGADSTTTLLNADEISETNDYIINSLVKYIELKQNSELDSSDKEVLIQSLCEFIIGESVTKYEEYISAFVVSKQDDLEFAKKLNTIKEGVVLYSGIQYNDNVNELGRWNSPLTLYLEQDVIFHLAGYNGELYQHLFEDFYNLVEEINSANKQPIVKLRYFSDIRDNINYFFGIAERIIDRTENLDHSNNAMYHIVKGCDFRSDVVDKKAALLNLLKNKSILEDEKVSYFNEATDHIYNIENDELAAELEKKLPETKIKKIRQSLKFLTYINIKRKGRNDIGFDGIRHILLSGNSTTIRIAFDDRVKSNGNVPFATYLDYITNKFWFKLNKSFGDSSYPKTFDIITRAQIVLSSQLSESVAKEFEQLEKKRKKGELSDEQAKTALSLIKQQFKFPEHINADNVDDALDAIVINDIEVLIRENEIAKQKAKEQVQVNVKLNESLQKERIEKKQSQQQIQQTEGDNQALWREVQRRLESELKQVNGHIESEVNRKQKADSLVNDKVQQIKFIPALIILAYIIIIALVIFWWSSWEIMEPIVYFATPTLLLIEYLYLAFSGKNINPFKWFNVDYKNSVTTKIYNDRDISIEELKSLKVRKKELAAEISLINTKPYFKMTRE